MYASQQSSLPSTYFLLFRTKKNGIFLTIWEIFTTRKEWWGFFPFFFHCKIQGMVSTTVANHYTKSWWNVQKCRNPYWNMFYTNRIFLSLKMLVISFLPLLQFPRTPDHFCPLQVIVHSSSVRLHLTVRLSPTLFFHDPLGSGGSAHPITARRQQNSAFKIYFFYRAIKFRT